MERQVLPSEKLQRVSSMLGVMQRMLPGIVPKSLSSAQSQIASLGVATSTGSKPNCFFVAPTVCDLRAVSATGNATTMSDGREDDHCRRRGDFSDCGAVGTGIQEDFASSPMSIAMADLLRDGISSFISSRLDWTVSLNFAA